MNALSHIPNPRPEALVHETFEGFRLLQSGEMRFECVKPTFEECRDLCAAGTPHKQQFIVRRTDHQSGAVMLHVFQIRQGERQYRGVLEGYVRQRRAEEISVIRVVEPQYPDETARVVGWPVGASRAVSNIERGA